jgi:hypothetical protein
MEIDPVAASNFDTTRVRLGDLVAAISGVILFLSLFLHWYSVSVKVAGFSESKGFSGWTVLSFIDILLFIIAVVVVGIAVARMAGAIPRMAVSPGLLVLGLGVLATLLVLYRIIDIPGDTSSLDAGGLNVDLSRSIGIFIALLASLGVAAGGWITWNEEGKPKPGGVGAGAGGPVGAGQPYGGQPAPGGYQQQAAAPAPAPTPAAPPAPVPPAASADAPPPGGAADWYPDPRGEKRLRYYDGSQWTHHTAD